MAHVRKRYLCQLIHQVKKFSPLIGVLGHRQVGKTTLLEQEVSRYVTFDDEETLRSVNQNPKMFLEEFRQLNNGIDECQLEPKLFPALKERVRQDKRPGQFLLSGSVRFTSRQAIRESLTGRIVNMDLLPFTISELRHHDLPSVAHEIIEIEDINQLAQKFEKKKNSLKSLDEYIDLYLERGGLPGICFIRDSKIRQERIAEQLQTILDRDIRMIFPTTLSFVQILNYLRALAQGQGEPLNFSQLRVQTGISSVTQKKLLYAFEAVFLLRTIPLIGGQKGVSVYFEDQAESKYLDKGKTKLKAFEELIYRNLRAEFMYQIGEHFQCFQYQTRSGARIPFAFETDKGVLGALPILEDEPTRSHFAMANSFLKKFLKSKVLIVTRNQIVQTKDERIIVLPASLVV